MRIGSNPNKNITQEQSDFFHQIIIPVYIPAEEGYFKDSFIIFEHHLNSIFNTVHPNTYISIINNGSCNKVKVYLDKLLDQKLIHEVIHTDNIGKINAVLKGISGHSFPIVTISDSDVMFLNNWQEETYKVFENFPKAGVVGLTPMINMSYYLTSNIFFRNLFSSKIKFSKIKNEKALLNFYTSIGREQEIIENIDKRNFVIERNNIKTCIGSGHYVASYRGDVFHTIRKFSNYKLGGDIEFQIDKLAFRKGLWRLNTHDNYAYHLGNTYEKWMSDELQNLKKSDYNSNFKLQKIQNISRLRYFIVKKIFQKIMNNKSIRNFLEKAKKE